jgi:hypothetical protein
MKTQQFVLGTLIVIIGFALIGCSDGGGGSSPPPPPNPDLEVKERSTTINLFEGKTATVSGEFDKAGLESAAGKIETAIQTNIGNAPDTIKEAIKDRYSKCEIMFVEKTSEYDHWTTIGDGKTIYISFGILDSNSLAGMIMTAIYSSIDKIDTQSHEWIWEVTTAPTIDTEGLETETCSQCRQLNGTRSIPKLISVTFSSAADFETWLTAQPVNTAYTPYVIVLNVSDLSGIKETLINNNTKFIILDLSDSTIIEIPYHAFLNTATSGSAGLNVNRGLIDILLPNSLKTIGNGAFYQCTDLRSVTIPDSVTSIGEWAFANCGTNLTSVTMGNNVTSIGDYVFSGNNGLTSLTIGNNITSIGNYAFTNSYRLTSITIPESVKSIGDFAFRSCTGLTSVIFEGTIPSNSFSSFSNTTGSTFPGDLRDKFYATDATNGTPGTYTTTAPGISSVWTKQ